MHNEGNDIEIIQINISGEDKPGMTSSLTAILARYDAFILDIGQANIHQSLTLRNWVSGSGSPPSPKSGTMPGWPARGRTATSSRCSDGA